MGAAPALLHHRDFAPWTTPQALAAPTVAEQLMKFNELRIAGVLSEDEFAAEKQKLLAQPGGAGTKQGLGTVSWAPPGAVSN
jgi:hypothetical protein